MAFVKFEARLTDIPSVSGQSKSGRFGFNRAAIREYDLTKYAHCFLFWDDITHRVGFIFLDKPELGSVRAKAYRNAKEGKYSLEVAAYSFASHYGITLSKIKKCPITQIGEMLVITIPNEALADNIGAVR